MKRQASMILTKPSIYLAMAAMFVTLALAGPAAAKKQVPFHGFIQAVEIDVVQPPAVCWSAASGWLDIILTWFSASAE